MTELFQSEVYLLKKENAPIEEQNRSFKGRPIQTGVFDTNENDRVASL